MNPRRPAYAGMLCLLLAGCQFIPGTDAHYIRQAETEVRNQVVDPASTSFRNERVVNSREGRLVCGEVNAKNRLGGFVGFLPFAYFVDQKIVDIVPAMEGTPEANMVIANFPKPCFGAS